MAPQLWDHWNAMVLAARPVVDSIDDARDCASEALTQYLEHHPDEVRNLEAFLVTVAKRRALDLTRADVRARRRDARFANVVSNDAPDVAEEIVARAEASWVDAEARRLLAPKVYELLLMVADGVPMHEIAERMGMTERAVQSHLLRARRVVRAALAKTLAALGLAAAGVRRWTTPAAASTAVLACAFALGVSSVPPGPDTPELLLLPETSAVPPPVRSAPGGVTAGSARAADHRITPRPGSRPLVREEVAAVRTPVVAARIEKRDDGQRSSNVVEQVQHCLENLRVEPGYQGCEEQQDRPSS